MASLTASAATRTASADDDEISRMLADISSVLDATVWMCRDTSLAAEATVDERSDVSRVFAPTSAEMLPSFDAEPARLVDPSAIALMVFRKEI
jgi:hypothetical protein